MLSNRMSFVDREYLSGRIGAVDFGYNLSCIARSPTSALLWSAGTSYWSSRGTSSYGTSCLYTLDREQLVYGHGYRRVGEEGGKLTGKRLAASITAIEQLFGETDLLPWLTHAIVNKQTVLIEGGGPRFTPSSRNGRTKSPKTTVDNALGEHVYK